MAGISEQLQKITSSISHIDERVREDFQSRIEKGKLLRNDDPVSHFCVFFVPYILAEKKVFFGHHTKANSWIAPGGHIEPEHERIEDTVIQEAAEELGVTVSREQISQPFLISVMNVHTPGRACGRHYSIWYTVNFEREEVFQIEEREFFAAKWMTIPEAKEVVTVPENLQALALLETM